MTRADYPLWVRLGLAGLPTRAAVVAFVWISIVAAVAGCIAGALWQPRLYLAALFLLAAAAYHFTVRWVDAHGDWSAR